MLLEQALEIIEYTDSDHYSDAIDLFNKDHLITGDTLPFLNVIFEVAPVQLCQQLKRAGFAGDVSIAKSECGTYVIYNAQQLSKQEAFQQLS